MEEAERLKARLDNVQAVEPILGALRTVSSGSRVLALKKMDVVESYRQDLLDVIANTSPHLTKRQRMLSEACPENGRRALLVIGSERGLCGAFNDVLAAYAEQVLQGYGADGTNVALMSLGTRALRALQLRGRHLVWSSRLSLRALPRYQLACELASGWLGQHRHQELDALEVVYNAYRGLAMYEPCKVRLLPLCLPVAPLDEQAWPPVIETDARCLYLQAVELWLCTSLYAIMLESAAAEHTARYRLLDGAAQNATRLIEELRVFLQVATQEAITSEMQDLASAAGLLGPRSL
jgi:F-type H+-transporting ATPase subunit gamma